MQEKEKKSTVKYSRIFYYFWKETKGYRGLVALSLVFVTLGSLTGSVIQPLIYQKMVDLISNSPLSAFEDLKKFSLAYTCGNSRKYFLEDCW